MRPSWVDIDLAAVRSNVRAFKELLGSVGVCTVVKADAYGHGDVPVAEVALEAGADCLAVALVEEGARLREAGVDAPILLLSEPALGDAHEVISWDLIPTVYTADFATALAESTGQSVGVHIKVDTGMHRVGAPADQAVELGRMIDSSERLTVAGLWTHLAVAEEDREFTARQIESFELTEKRFAADGIDLGIRHLANTAGAMLHPEARRDMVRIGLGTYGLYPSPECSKVATLRPAMRVVTHISHMKRLPAGARPSYGRRRALGADSNVATAPIGYADGVPRLLSARGGEVLINGTRFPFAGTVTMDQIVIDVGDEDVAVGDEVVMIGRQGGEEIGADEWADKLDTISYEVVCGIGPRMPRRYSD